MSDRKQISNIDNLKRAWRWIQSNPEAKYKAYFRHLYRNYSVAEEELLNDLAERLQNGKYEAAKATKIYIPKPSGILRPISLLTVEDQIVYQAAVNVIADKLLPQVKNKYNKRVFGNQYAGKSSTWFYRKWDIGYRAFNNAAKKSFRDGMTYKASFDLMACYDSLDHGVLCYFLDKLGIEREFCNELSDWLGKWTATDEDIYHNHGIPQGPLSSGLLAEVVLSHFDKIKIKGIDFEYLRYVDDIHIYAQNEHDLRLVLVELDLASKDIGLFPQSSKISLHKVTNIEDEIKNISDVLSSYSERGFSSQEKLNSALQELSPKYRVIDATRFKYLLGQVKPNAKLTKRLWRIYENHPELYINIANYLRKYEKLPLEAGKIAIDVIKCCVLYPTVLAEFIGAVDGRLSKEQDAELASYLKKKWASSAQKPSLVVTLSKYLIRTGDLNPSQIIDLSGKLNSWWASASLIDALDIEYVGRSLQNKIVDEKIQSLNSDVALSAAHKCYLLEQKPNSMPMKWNRSSSILLKEVGLTKRRAPGLCGISRSFNRITQKSSGLGWKNLFGSDYRQAERQAIEMATLYAVNPTAFVNALDVFNELLLNAIFAKDRGLGNYQLGKIGSVLNEKSRFASKYPETYRYAKEVHDKRCANLLSHPVAKATQKPTTTIKFKYLPTVRRLIVNSLHELKNKGI